MVRLTVLAGRRSGYTTVGVSFPLVFGRGSVHGLDLDDPGVWENHATLELDPAGEFVLRSRPEAEFTVNGAVGRQERLRNGDQIGLGGARLVFSLSETHPRGFRLREYLTWTAVFLLCLLQVALVYSLLP